MGAQGTDIQLSAAARARIPFAIECKNVEKINLWAAWAQAAANTPAELEPLLVVARNRTEPLVVMRFEDFLSWLARVS